MNDLVLNHIETHGHLGVPWNSPFQEPPHLRHNCPKCSGQLRIHLLFRVGLCGQPHAIKGPTSWG